MVNGSGNWSITVNPALVGTNHSASIRLTDAAGNVSSATNVNFTLDTTAPVIPSYTASPNPTSGTVSVVLTPVESGATTSIP